VRPPRARCRTVRLRASACPLVSVSTPAPIVPRTGPRVPREYPPSTLYTFRVPVHVLWKVCAHCGTAGVPFVARARRGHACSTPLEYPCAVPSRTTTHAATACCAGVSARHGPVHTHFTAQQDEPCTLQVFRLELAERHDPRRAVGAQLADWPVRPPCARCRAVRVRASAGPLVSISTAACVRTHRRTAVRVPSPHVAVSTLAAAPRSGPAPWGTRYRSQYP
jgi:hypothetical protein